MASSAVFSAIAGVLAWVLRAMLKRDNRRLDADPTQIGFQRYVW